MIFISVCAWDATWEWKRTEVDGGKNIKRHREGEERQNNYISRRAEGSGEKLSYLCCNGGKRSLSWLELPWRWLAPSIWVHDCICVYGRVCVRASEHLEMFVSVYICVCERLWRLKWRSTCGIISVVRRKCGRGHKGTAKPGGLLCWWQDIINVCVCYCHWTRLTDS